MATPHASSWRRALVTNETGTTATPAAVQTARPTIAIPITGVSAMVRLFGVGSANDTVVGDFYMAERINNTAIAEGEAIDRLGAAAYFTTKIATLTATLGTQAGVAGGVVSDTELLADTMVISSETTFLTHREAVLTSDIVTFSPADNTIAEVVFSDFGNADMLVFVATTVNPTSYNLLVRQVV